MSKPSTQPTRYIRKPRLKTDDLSIIANEVKGKIVSFIVKYKGEEKTFPIANNKIEKTFKEQVEPYAANLLTPKPQTNAISTTTVGRKITPSRTRNVTNLRKGLRRRA